ncbi:phage tail tube protein [Sphingomonas nostoxanthinifaciens]|uniref:phage tail tube protein n=1 Tax=Sphingomonas nostoxanthinifaciens TaxID=2872652 RepID=UPI001CC21DD9|nr:phage tail tube protein [Sphingomonas nostoxanthinifaciens]UAK24184.1 hypothetical protein K8P63_17935 [Sphingomonas nostoxanthinifaciens]
MGRARGSNALLTGAFETTAGVAPGPGFAKMPFVSHTLGEERPLIASDLLGQGREPQDPTPDVATNTGDVVVPVDVRNFWYWLKLFFGQPVSAAGSGAETVHTFTSGLLALPSMSLEIGSPEIPTYSTHYGARGNQLKISLARSGLLNATCSLICIGESDPSATSISGAPTTKATQRFPQATGSVKKDGAQLGSVVAADFTFTNNLETVDTIKSDGRIEDSDPGMVGMSGSVTVRFKDTVLLAAASASPPTPVELDFGWTSGAHSLIFSVPRVFLPRPKRPISGPNGIQAVFNWQASGAAAASVIATLTNDIASYA